MVIKMFANATIPTPTHYGGVYEFEWVLDPWRQSIYVRIPKVMSEVPVCPIQTGKSHNNMQCSV